MIKVLRSPPLHKSITRISIPDRPSDSSLKRGFYAKLWNWFPGDISHLVSIESLVFLLNPIGFPSSRCLRFLRSLRWPPASPGRLRCRLRRKLIIRWKLGGKVGPMVGIPPIKMVMTWGWCMTLGLPHCAMPTKKNHSLPSIRCPKDWSFLIEVDSEREREIAKIKETIGSSYGKHAARMLVSNKHTHIFGG